MSGKLQVDIVTPSKKVFSGESDAVSLPGAKSPFQILYNHAAIVSNLESGVIKLKNEGKETIFKSGIGFAEVNNNKVSVLVEEIEQED
jgi:F-type H+-transporting ATPase subunit epsilon